MGKERRGITPCGGCSTIELLPRQAGQIGFEPTTRDNPQLRPIKLRNPADKKATVVFPGVLLLHHHPLCGRSEIAHILREQMKRS